jgi:hypothetical protein
VTGLEALAVVIATLAPVVTGVSMALIVVERRKLAFVHELARALPPRVRVEQVCSGDVREPLTLTLVAPDGDADVDTRVSALLRGDQRVWHVERRAAGVAGGAFCLLERGWRPPNGEDRPLVAELHPRLLLHSDDKACGHALPAHVRDQLVQLLVGRARAFKVSTDQVFLEVPRHGLSPSEALGAVARLDAVLGILGVASAARFPLSDRGADHGGHAPDGAPVGVPVWNT